MPAWGKNRRAIDYLAPPLPHDDPSIDLFLILATGAGVPIRILALSSCKFRQTTTALLPLLQPLLRPLSAPPVSPLLFAFAFPVRFVCLLVYLLHLLFHLLLCLLFHPCTRGQAERVGACVLLLPSFVATARLPGDFRLSNLYAGSSPRNVRSLHSNAFVATLDPLVVLLKNHPKRPSN